MPKDRILVVDDEPDSLWALRHNLSDEGYEVLTAADGMEALHVASRHQPDLIILDIRMPGMDGIEVCRKIRRDPLIGAVPIIFLTALDGVEDLERGLYEGGDDYVVKPVDFKELKARVVAVLRRSQPVRGGVQELDGRRLLTSGDVSLDLDSHQVEVRGRITELTPAQFRLLRYLMGHPGEVFTPQHLLEHALQIPPDSASDTLLRWHIMELRTKIERDPGHPIHIRNVRGHGYMFDRRASADKAGE